MRGYGLILAVILSLHMGTDSSQAQTREQKVRQDRDKVVAEGFWIYNDLLNGFAQGKKTGKPILVVLRCLPCTECVKLDDDLLDKDPEVRQLLTEFVRVRVVSTNGLDLSLFQFDTDQSFAVFFLNPDGTIYGRFGTRSHRTEWEEDVSVAGLARAMEGALELHRNYDAVKASLAGKRGKPLEFLTPEQYPLHRGKYTSTINYQGDVVKSCIHCHQIGDARRDYYWETGKPLPEQLMFPYPHPKVVGLILDPTQRAKVREVTSGSWADQAGFRAGDTILTLSGQPLLSMADVQWVFDQTNPQGAQVEAVVDRNGRQQKLTINLPDHWRREGDLDWRVSSWNMRRKFFGGMKLDALNAADRQKAGIVGKESAMLVKHVGKYAPHNFAQRSGFQEGDIIVSFDGMTEFDNETDLFIHASDHFQAGQTIDVGLIRNGKRQTKKLTLP